MTADSSKFPPGPSVLALSGGIGGAKLNLGLYQILDPWKLAVIANTGDDFRHMGLMICPDLDTIMYTLSGQSDTGKGWGRSGETWTCLEELKRLGADSWFGLGDKDLAVHMLRTARLDAGDRLGRITADLFERFGVKAHVMPMTDTPVGTIVQTQDGRNLPFQHYFVREQCAAEVAGFIYEGSDSARPADGLIAQITDPGLAAIVICPSNPFVSINPILSVPGVRDALRTASVPVVAVSPLVGGQSVKGPLAKMFRELGQVPSNAAIAAQYADILTGMVVDQSDQQDVSDLQVPAISAPTVMHSLDDRKALAETVLDFAASLTGARK